jgi:hypothetical protein
VTNGIVNGNNSYVDGNVINSDTIYKVIVYDKYNSISSVEKKYSFVNDFYYGVINDILLTETLIKSLTGLKTLKTNLSETFTPSNQKILFAYPQSYGNLTNINDDENYDMINGFSKSNVNITLNGNVVPYNVYTSNYLIKDANVNLTFEF